MAAFGYFYFTGAIYAALNGLPTTGARPPKDGFFYMGARLMMSSTSILEPEPALELPKVLAAEVLRVLCDADAELWAAVAAPARLLLTNSSAACVALLLFLKALPGLFE